MRSPRPAASTMARGGKEGGVVVVFTGSEV
jgi:hypothetical protein